MQSAPYASRGTFSEGLDFGAGDMIIPDEQASDLLDFYKDSTIFLTGATGYLGKMFMEKLLRDCYDLKRIYILMRSKKGKDIEKRFDEIFDGPNMEPLKRKRPNFIQKVKIVSGDCALPDVGLNNDDKQTLINEVNIIIHCAATVRFDEKLRNATNINVRSVIDLLEMAKQMKNLKSFVYVSTAFANCPLKKIEEKLYEPPISPKKLMTLCDALDDDKLDKITPILLGEWPNSYVFTKAVAENVMKMEAQKLPAAVLRPSIVIASVKEPVAGWIDNLYGATGVLVGAALGVLRTLHGRAENKAEMVPADYVINSGLAVAWDVANKKSINPNKERNSESDSYDEVPVYNFISSEESPITWKIFTKLAEKHCKKIPSELQIWYYFFALRPCYYQNLIATFLYHTLPAYIIDAVAMMIGKKPQMVKGYQKINKFARVISDFSTKEWKFTNDNVQKLWEKLNPRDKSMFEFSMKNFNWDDYFVSYSKGARAYLLKDPLDTIPKGAVKYYKLMVAHYALLAVLTYLLFKLVCWFLGF